MVFIDTFKLLKYHHLVLNKEPLPLEPLVIRIHNKQPFFSVDDPKTLPYEFGLAVFMISDVYSVLFSCCD